LNSACDALGRIEVRSRKTEGGSDSIAEFGSGNAEGGIEKQRTDDKEQKVRSWEGEKVGAAFDSAELVAGSRDNYAGFVNANTHYRSRKSEVRIL
jgi:hypothetical protein